MLSEATLHQALRAAGLDAPVRFEEVTGSTNAVALELAEAGTPEWTLVAAGHQTAGRGRLGRTWLSEPGRSLTFSFVLRPRLAPLRTGLLTLLVGASMAEAAGAQTGVELRCKWPNDLVVGERKAGGILGEAKVEGDEVRHVVLGIGVNLSDPPSEVTGATGLGLASPGEAAGPLLAAFLTRFRTRYRPEDVGFGPSVLSVWREVSATLGRRVRATTVGGEAVEGLAVDVDEAGALLVETDDGLRAVAFGEIAHLDA
jgi:BirA family biotin operon repressor/biotin-[acetyl-CoA-carboxylase] ligase